MIEKVKGMVRELLSGDKSGHGFDHIMRVYDLALKFAEDEKADKTIVGLASLLHDVDDYKLFGQENAENLTNAKQILKKACASEQVSSAVLKIIKSMGYSKLLKGIRPDTIEGAVVSDSDMCDAIGANGVLRTFAYSLLHNRTFFDKDIWPILDISADKYVKKTADTSVCHFFEKLLKLKNLMMTESGKKEAIDRNEIMIEFLRHLFKEDNVPEWNEFLENYLKEL